MTSFLVGQCVVNLAVTSCVYANVVCKWVCRGVGLVSAKHVETEVNNKHLIVASCWFFSLHTLLTMHGHRNLKSFRCLSRSFVHPPITPYLYDQNPSMYELKHTRPIPTSINLAERNCSKATHSLTTPIEILLTIICLVTRKGVLAFQI